MGADLRVDSPEDGKWMSYAELGQARGISKESALKLALRKKWRKQADNRGTVRVCVPTEFTIKPDLRVDTRADARVDVRADMSMDAERTISLLREQFEQERSQLKEIAAVLTGHVTTLQEQVARERATADHARRAGELDRAAAAEREGRLLALVEGLSAELARLQAAPAPISEPEPEAEVAPVREDELSALPDDQLMATMAAEVARARALVPAPAPRRGFLARLLNRKPAAPTV
jgi:hypothetical protein